MRNKILKSVLVFVASTLFLGLTLPVELAGFCVPYPPPDNAYRIYYHNSGLNPYSIQDKDMDRPEFQDFMSQFSGYLNPNYGVPVIADYFTGCYGMDEEPHGVTVKRFFDFAYNRANPDIVETSNFLTWAEMIQYIAANYGRGTVVNLSNGTLGWEKFSTAAVQAAYDAEVLLVGAPLTFAAAPHHLFDKVLQTWMMDGEGEFLASPSMSIPNLVAVGVCTNWRPNDYFIAHPGIGGGSTAGWEGEFGSFSTPLLAGAAQHIADAVASRGLPTGDYLPKVLDYIISGCDRIDDPESYEHRLNEDLPSFGPWSTIWGYGVLSPWKSLIYAYGFGVLEPKDSSIDPVDDPITEFSDHFLLRGDLFVPADQAFRVSPLASVSIDPTTPSPEGPTDLGMYPTLHDIRVAGTMEVATSLENGVNATIAIDAGGSCTIKDGGLVTISSGQFLQITAGGELNVETGGEIVIEDGGYLTVLGDFNYAGTVTMNSGGMVIFGPTANVYLEADLNIPAGATFLGSPGSITTVASSDAAGAGSDPSRVEITCEGIIQLLGSTNDGVVIKGENSGAGEWVGITFNSVGTSASAMNYAQISDAEIGLAISGSAPVYTVVGLDVTSCGTGMKVTGRHNISLLGTDYGGEISDCTNGVQLNGASITINGMSIHDHGVGIHATMSSPSVRDCGIYANNIGVATFDGYSIPDLGTVANPGNNDFHGPGMSNTNHIVAVDPFDDIYAQMNWWGTTKTRKIQQKIWVIRNIGTGTVIFQPFLTGPPVGDPPLVAEKDDPREPVFATPNVNHLSQNYPNPFNPVTTIKFGLKESSRVSLRIYNASGQLVRVLVDAQMDPGNHERLWNGTDSSGNAVTSGIYFYRLITNSFTETKKMVLLR